MRVALDEFTAMKKTFAFKEDLLHATLRHPRSVRALRIMRCRPLMLSSVVLLAALSGCTTPPPAASAAEFAQADSNHDGQLDADEYKRLIAIRAAGGDEVAAQTVKSNLRYDTYSTRFEYRDRNGDDVLSAQELGLK
jgi:hypothetical protein